MKKIITYIIYIFIIIISVSFFFKIDYPHKKSIFIGSLILLLVMEGYYFLQKNN